MQQLFLDYVFPVRWAMMEGDSLMVTELQVLRTNITVLMMYRYL